MLDKLTKLRDLIPLPNPPMRKIDRIYKILQEKYPAGMDPWGLDMELSKKTMPLAYTMYKHYFRVRVIGKEKVQDQPYMVVSNHSGQIPIDAALISLAFIIDITPPRVLRAMIERFVTSLPFIGSFINANGGVLGDRDNCYHLLNRGETILVFPEGVRGVSKSTSDYYHIQNFTKGFFRLSLRAQTDILPMAVVGAEEFFPFVYQAKGIARTLGLPALPLSPTYFPLPSPVDIIIGDPYPIPKDMSPDAPDEEVDRHVKIIEDQIRSLVEKGLKERRTSWISSLTNNSSFIKNVKK